MGRKRIIKTDEMLVQEIWDTCDNLRSKGVDLSKVQFIPENTKAANRLYEELHITCKKLKASGADLNIPIILSRHA